MANEQLLDTICSTLKESDERPRSQISSILEALGPERTSALVTETEKIENEGGMPVPDGSRRRTPGGVFFYLARRALAPADRARIFPNNTKPAGQPKPPQAPKPPPQQPQRQQQPALPPRRRVIEVDVIPSRAASRAVPQERGFDRGRSFERATPTTPASIREQVLQLPAPQRRALVLELVDDLFGLEDATPSGAISADGVAAVKAIDLSGELSRRVQALVPDMTALVKLLAATALRAGAAAIEPPPESSPPPSSAKQVIEPAAEAPRKRPAKATPEDRVIRALEADPGMRIEDLAEELDLETKQLSPVVKKLLEADRIYSTGQKRGTRYFVR